MSFTIDEASDKIDEASDTIDQAVNCNGARIQGFLYHGYHNFAGIFQQILEKLIECQNIRRC